MLGLVWAFGSVVAVLLAPTVLALWMAPVAAAAAAQLARTWRRAPGGRHPVPEASFVAAGLVVLASALGVTAFVVAALVAAVGAAAWATNAATRRAGDAASGVDVVLTVLCAAVPAMAAAGPILLRGNGLVAALVVVTYALVYDAASWVIGSGSRHRWIGPLAGIACIGSITLGVGSIFPQFKGDSAAELGILAAVLAPAGTVVASLVLGDRRARVPALRRLDSLVLLGSVWALAAAHLGV
jgi:hypothetical protein